MPSVSFNAQAILATLRDFQRTSVDYAFQRMYLDEHPTSRFLIADEVGLGKTYVAKGIVARAVEHLSVTKKRIDIIYVCSNSAIASQNLERLNISPDETALKPTRPTLLIKQLHGLKTRAINLLSMTPGTGLSMGNRAGTAEERALLFHLLIGEEWISRTPLRNLLRGDVLMHHWERRIQEDLPNIDRSLAKEFVRGLKRDRALKSDLKAALLLYQRDRGSDWPQEHRNAYMQVVSRLRELLATICLRALSPDLIILDEFQRFKDLLNAESEIAELAQLLFRQPNAKTLLLSATPYRMYTRDEEEDKHHEDFLNTLSFLIQDPAEIETIRRDLDAFRSLLVNSGQRAATSEVKASLERRMRLVMSRQERTRSAQSRDAMVAEVLPNLKVTQGDLEQALRGQALATAVGGVEFLEYWKSTSHPLSFLGRYELGTRLLNPKSRHKDPEAVAKAMRSANRDLLRPKEIGRFEKLTIHNGRLRYLLQRTIDRGMWKLLWMPPSLPYLKPNGIFAELEDATKFLVFSSWDFVPDAISTFCSYEAERRMVLVHKKEETYERYRIQSRPPLRFARDARRDRFTGMSALCLLAPWPKLAELGDPLPMAVAASSPLGIEKARVGVRNRLRPLVERLIKGAPAGGAYDNRWYWMAPAYLDPEGAKLLSQWCEAKGQERSIDSEEESTLLQDHFSHLADSMRQGLEDLGRPPKDLLENLVDLALAGPGVCAYRSLRRVAATTEPYHASLLSAAWTTSQGFRSLFNEPDVVHMLRRREDEPYWTLVLDYCLRGNLQAVLDEYAHILRESLSLQGKPAHEAWWKISEEIRSASGLRTSLLHISQPSASHSGPKERTLKVRCRFAIRFSEIQESEQQSKRVERVQDSFNSPFRPFVLASTAIGQEGLDFHRWCHAVVHWNLPSNPVDLEQREGRIHRFKGHAVRKNIARHYGLGALSNTWEGSGDPWEALFAKASQDRPEGSNELHPYWIFETEGGSKVERHIPILPLSKEVARYRRLKRSLALYRLAFGQPRQEDLLACLDDDQDADALDLSPPTTNSFA